MLKELITKNRSYRRFVEDAEIERKGLEELVELARLSASGANLQPLKYWLCCKRDKNAAIFPTLAWAGYLKDWAGPAEGERPAAYIVVLGDTNIGSSFDYDAGIAAQNILLGAVEKGLGGCIIGSVQREKLRQALNIPKHLKILVVLALGEPKEKVVIDTADPETGIEYYRDAEDVHHVPKRPLDSIIVG